MDITNGRNITYTFTTVKSLFCCGIQIGTELGESSDLTVLGQEKLQGTSNLLHGLELGSGTDTRDRKTDVNGRSDTLVEEFGLQEDLSISNGNDVCWDIGGHITTLCLDKWESSQGTTAVLIGHLGGTLQKTGVEVEDISWVSLTSGWATEKERHLAIRDGLFGKIVVDDESVHSVITEVFTEGSTRKRCDVLKTRIQLVFS
jgi:hypothetical protein